MISAVSKSRVVSIKPSQCAHAGCINRVAQGKTLCTLHDVNPMFSKALPKPTPPAAVYCGCLPSIMFGIF